MSYSTGADSEVGSLRTVLVHRPGPELKRITPRTIERLEFDGLPWVAQAQREHDAFADVLRRRGIDVLYVTELLQDILEYSSARDEAIASVIADAQLGQELAHSVRSQLDSLAPEDLAGVLVAGLTVAELRAGRGLVYELYDPHDFVVDPLPNLVFSRDASVWIGDQAIVGSLAGPRRRESLLLGAIYGHHPRFIGLPNPYRAGQDLLDGGDVLLLAPGVVAVGVGPRTTAASAERLARHLLNADLAHTVLAVPTNQRGHGGLLDMVCTVADIGTVVMVPALAFTLTALTITARADDLHVSRPRPFLEAAAGALGLDRLTVIDTGVDPPAGGAGQWDDGGNALAIGNRSIVCDERNVETNSRLSAAGFEVITIAAGELGRSRRESGGRAGHAGRAGPRCICTAIQRDPAPAPDRTDSFDAFERLGQVAAVPHRSEPALPGARLPEPAGSVSDQRDRVSELAPLR